MASSIAETTAQAEHIERARVFGAQIVTRADSNAYPAALHDLRDPPDPLWAMGVLTTASEPAVAIVGTRNATGAGLRAANAIATACARAGVSVVSGLARGIDGAAHEAALACGGRTVAVLGTGIDIAFPGSHRALQRRIGTDGLLLTEIEPGSRGHRGTFPRRNRIIAALAAVTIVVEAGEESGALITARYAQELGRRLGVVPGSIESPASKGTNRLIKQDHAEPILHPDDVLALFDIDPSPPALPMLDDDAARCWDALQRGASTPHDLARVAKLSMRATMASVSALELEGLVSIDASGRIRSNVAATVR